MFVRSLLASTLFAIVRSEAQCWADDDGTMSCVARNPDAVTASSMIQVKKAGSTKKTIDLAEAEGETKVGGDHHVTMSDNPDTWVSAVNEKRAAHGSCPLAWAQPLADGIKEWVDGLTSLHHADSYHIPPPGGPCGENLAWASNGVSEQQSVDMWYSESNDCATGGPDSFSDGCQQPKPGKMTGHFTAMIWKGAQTMGCAISSNGQYSGCRWKAGDQLSAETPNMAMPGLYAANVGHLGEHASGC